MHLLASPQERVSRNSLSHIAVCKYSSLEVLQSVSWFTVISPTVHCFMVSKEAQNIC